MISRRFPGLVLVLPRSGRAWTWTDFFVVANKAGDEVRVDRFETPCRFCGEPFTATAKIPRGIVRRYLTRCMKVGENAEVRLNLLPDRKAGNFDRVNCPRHLWSPAPRPTEIDLVPGAEGLL